MRSTLKFWLWKVDLHCVFLFHNMKKYHKLTFLVKNSSVENKYSDKYFRKTFWKSFLMPLISLHNPTKIIKALFRKKRFVLDEMTQWNVSKFAIFNIYTKTQSCFFHFSFHANLFYFLMNALVYVNIGQGIH